MQNVFTEERWSSLAADWTAWWNHDTDRPMLTASRAINPARKRAAWWGLLPTVPFEITPEEIAEEIWQGILNTEYAGDLFPSAFTNFGPGDVIGFIGGGVVPAHNTTWFNAGIWEGKGLREIKPVYDPDNRWLKRVHAVMRACVEKFDGRALVSFSDLGGNLDIAAPLRDTQTLLMDTLDDPDAVRELVGRITKLWLKYYDDEYEIIRRGGRGCRSWLPLWAPGSTYNLQCDFSYMIGPEQFAELVMPDLEACCEHIEYPFFHLDGPGILTHLDMLLSIPKLRGIQWFAGDWNADRGMPSCKWTEVLDRILAAGKLIQMHGSFNDFIALAKERPLKNFALDVVYDLPPGVPLNDALAEIWRVNKSV